MLHSSKSKRTTNKLQKAYKHRREIRCLMKEQKRHNDKASSKRPSPKPVAEKPDLLARQRPPLSTLIQRTGVDFPSLTPQNMLQLQRTVGNQALSKLSPGSERVISRKIEPDKMNLVGENHEESQTRRGKEKAMLKEKYHFSENQYWA